MHTCMALIYRLFAYLIVRIIDLGDIYRTGLPEFTLQFPLSYRVHKLEGIRAADVMNGVGLGI